MVKIVAAGLTALCLVVVLFAAAAAGLASTIFGGGRSAQPSASAVSDIPPHYLALYQAASSVCPGLDWSILAAIGKVETNHGRSGLPGVHNGVNSAGAAGVMQFLRPSFDAVISRHAIPPGGATPPSPYNPHDAIYAAAYYLCDSGANRGDLHSAIFSYNHAEWYVAEVLAQARQYSSAPVIGANTSPSDAARQAISYATGQLGLPYVWGGNGVAEGGFDCSGLTMAAYHAGGITLPRTADAQYRAGPRVPAGAPVLPGDLVFYGTESFVHHVGLYLGAGQMINAPDVGQTITIQPYQAPDYLGATRPAN